MFGHSLGGSAAAEAVRLYPELQAGVDLDGSPRGQVLSSGLDKPFGAILSTIRRVDDVDDGFATWFEGLRGPHPLLQLDDVHHDGLSDFVVFNPQVTAHDPALGALLEAVLHTDVTGVDVGVASIVTQRRFLAGFFARYLQDAHSVEASRPR
jgi:pimeloyl-ACP methyl ester carboxylesterase